MSQNYMLDAVLHRLANEVASILITMPAERRSTCAGQFLAHVESLVQDFETELQALNMLGEGCPNSQGLS